MLTTQGLKFMPQAKCDYLDPDSELGHVKCFTGQAFVKEMFLDSDTDVAVLTFAPTSYEDMALTDDEAAATREMVDAMDGNHRLLVHGRVIPNFDGDIARMPELARTMADIAAWKTYTQASPDGSSGLVAGRRGKRRAADRGSARAAASRPSASTRDCRCRPR